MTVEDQIRPVFTRRMTRGQLIAVDLLVAVLYSLVLIGVVLSSGNAVPGVRVAIAAAIALPLAVRRIWPVPVFAVVLAATLTAIYLGVLHEPFIAAALAVYLIAVTEPRRRWEPVLAIGIGSGLIILCSSVVGTRQWWVKDYGLIVVGVAVIGATWTVGRAVRERRAYAARTAAQAVDRAATEERLRIARELHDVVAHSMGVIAVKAGVANHVVETRPQEARDALRVIESASRSALVELRHMLGVLRSDTGDDGPLAPTPGLTRVPELVERAALAGVPVDLDLAPVEGLPEGVELAAYRIIQEALTNVVKHAAPAHCRVRLGDDGSQVTIEVTDDGPGRRLLPESSGGHGMLGMRERVAVYGGSLTAGPSPGGGYRVTATLPYRSVPYDARGQP